jgi:tRNA dimethylallyltransferase
MSRGVLVIAGATATGKTDVALALARELGGELVGADSVQVYRGFDIGSAKPTAEELSLVPHHLIDVADPDEAIDAIGYAALADEAIARIAARGKVPVVVGGTGLWLRALLRGLVDVPKPDPNVRSRLESEIEREGAASLHTRLAAVDPRAAAAIHPNDAVRIVRALEVYEQTGEPLGELRARHALGAPRYDGVLVVVERPKEELDARIAARVRAMLDAGWADEVARLVERWGKDVRGLHSVGYEEMVAHVTEGVPIDETERRIAKSTRDYARRQRNWFRSEPGFDTIATPEELLANGTLRERMRAITP